MILMVLLLYSTHHQKNKLLGAFLASAAFAIVFGIRWMVGTDFEAYLNGYEIACVGMIDTIDSWEIGFRYIFIVCSKYNCHYSIPFGIIAFLQVYFLFIGLYKYSNVWISLTLTLMLSCIWLSYSNIMRHMLAFSIFVYSIQFLANKQYIKYVASIFMATLCHSTAIILLIFPIIYKFREYFFSKVWAQLILLTLSLILMNVNVVQTVFEKISPIVTLMGYDHYIESRFAGFDEEATFGLARLTILIINIILICYSNKTKEFYKSKRVAIIYDLYFIGVLVHYAFFRMFLIQRLDYYFLSFDFIFGAFTLYSLLEKRKYLIYSALIILYIIIFFVKMRVAEDITAAYSTFFSK